MTRERRPVDAPSGVPGSGSVAAGVGVRRPAGGVVAVAAAATAVLAMGLAPVVGSWVPRGGYVDDVPSGTNGVAHYAAAGREADVQLVSLDPAPPAVAAAAGVTSGGSSRRVVAVGLRLAAARASDLLGCRVRLVGEAGVVDARPVAVAGSGCDAGVPRTRGPVEVLTTTYLSLPRDVVVLEVQVMWEPPQYVRFRAL